MFVTGRLETFLLKLKDSRTICFLEEKEHAENIILSQEIMAHYIESTQETAS